MNQYPAKYYDAQGSENTTIINDGENITAVLRGIEFSGRDFDSWKAPKDTNSEQLRKFTLNQGCLCSCRIECQIPVPIHHLGKPANGVLWVNLLLGDPTPKGGLDKEELGITLEYNEARFAGSGNSGWFEDELLEIQAKLPEGVFIKACINCMYSDYSPYGHGLFGFMMCFRNIKQEYVTVTTKDGFWAVHDRYDRVVQETYLCPEFERRIPGTGYRG